MRNEFSGSIVQVRAIEDAIRATKKYSKGIFRKPISHPIQGEDFPSKILTEYYEVYPTTEVSWDMSVGKAIEWLAQVSPCIDIHFTYDYRCNKASIRIKDGATSIKLLKDNIPNFREALEQLSKNGHG